MRVKSINCTGFLKKKLFSECMPPLFSKKKNCSLNSGASLNSRARIRILATQEAARSCFFFSCVSNTADHGIHEQ